MVYHRGYMRHLTLVKIEIQVAPSRFGENDAVRPREEFLLSSLAVYTPA
ncbi:predicted protein [Sclerotinia sclerotiorum 1980 UF-70]|uniref:Uncharacterized protein n=1 Tax=Sclerotinia sclerotiorum (strain ATCC 18683 / 1980 / Ss-1) TaxID=665079 RepID=A7EQK7_SCLS1|nr:predicted protein [Sclerotinia sclerotiorum 1980 UF-70]EDN91749.1 predicted protein [Sclerotinia sclerotiorum 1980 UF-70]